MNFEPFVNAVLSVAKNDQTDKTSTVLIDAVRKAATYPYDYKNFETINNVLTVSELNYFFSEFF